MWQFLHHKLGFKVWSTKQLLQYKKKKSWALPPKIVIGWKTQGQSSCQYICTGQYWVWRIPPPYSLKLFSPLTSHWNCHKNTQQLSWEFLVPNCRGISNTFPHCRVSNNSRLLNSVSRAFRTKSKSLTATQEALQEVPVYSHGSWNPPAWNPLFQPSPKTATKSLLFACLHQAVFQVKCSAPPPSH